jgi:hypothetical protein
VGFISYGSRAEQASCIAGLSGRVGFHGGTKAVVAKEGTSSAAPVAAVPQSISPSDGAWTVADFQQTLLGKLSGGGADGVVMLVLGGLDARLLLSAAMAPLLTALDMLLPASRRRLALPRSADLTTARTLAGDLLCWKDPQLPPVPRSRTSVEQALAPSEYLRERGFPPYLDDYPDPPGSQYPPYIHTVPGKVMMVANIGLFDDSRYVFLCAGNGRVHLLAMDCEMCESAFGKELARISIVDEDEHERLNVLVRPTHEIRDYKVCVFRVCVCVFMAVCVYVCMYVCMYV